MVRAALVAYRLADPAPSGLGRYVRELAMAVARVARDGDSFILTSAPEPGPVDWAPAELEVQRMRWSRKASHLAWTLGRGPRIERSLGDVDVVHLLHPFPPVPSRAPTVVTIPDLMALEQPASSTAFERWTYRRSVELAVARARRIIAISEYMAEHLVAALGIERSRITAIPHGVTAAFARAVPDEERRAICARYGVTPSRYVVYVGNVSTRKNLLPVVKAVASLGANSVPLLAIGRSSVGSAELDEELGRLGLRDHVRRTGHLPDDEVAALVQGAAMLVHPSLGEGFGLTVLEAMAAGVPVAASNLASLPEVVGDAGSLVDDPTEPTSWAEAIARLLDDVALRDAFVARGRQRAARFTWEHTAIATISVYRDVLRAATASDSAVPEAR